MMELAIEPTVLSRSERINSLTKVLFTLRKRCTTERRKFMCKPLGASDRMRSKVARSTQASTVGPLAAVA